MPHAANTFNEAAYLQLHSIAWIGQHQETREGLRELLRFSLIIVASVPVLAIYPFVEKYFVRGVMIGSIKGMMEARARLNLRLTIVPCTWNRAYHAVAAAACAGFGTTATWGCGARCSALRYIFPMCHGPATLDSLLCARRPTWQGQRPSR